MAAAVPGPPECPTCGKRQWPVIHSCTGIRPVTAVPGPREDIDWSAHRGSCRVFYAERRCTCATVPVPRFRDQLAESADAMRWSPDLGVIPAIPHCDGTCHAIGDDDCSRCCSLDATRACVDCIAYMTQDAEVSR